MVDSKPSPFKYEWKKDGDGSTFVTTQNPPVIHNVQKSDAGNYIIKVTNRMNLSQGVKRGHGVQLVNVQVLCEYCPSIKVLSKI